VRAARFRTRLATTVDHGSARALPVTSIPVVNVLTYVVLGVVAIRLLSAARLALTSDGRSTVRLIFGRIRWRHLWPVPFVLTAVAVLATLFWMVPGLHWGWWAALGGEGNPVAGSTSQTAGTFLEWLIPVVFLLLVLPALPLFALAEERIFRRGSEHWSPGRRAWKIISFGLVHALIGIPIAVALALSAGGVYFMAVYLRRYRRVHDQRDAVLESTTAHTAYNTFILLTGLIVIVLDALRII